MSQRERHDLDDPQEWLERAKSNLARAKHRIPDAFLEDFCFDAQQAAEKAIKAVLISRGIHFPYTHDLAHLMTMLEENGEQIPDMMRNSSELTQYASNTRYPGYDAVVSEQEYIEAVEMAEAVVRWAEEHL